MVLSFILLLGMPALTHAQSAKDAVMALRILQGKTQEGIVYKDYGTALVEAKFPVNLYLESNDAKKYPELSISLNKVMAHYEYAGRIWKRKITEQFGTFIGVDTVLGKEIGRLYPNANKDKDEGGAILKRDMFGREYIVEYLLPFIWAEASTELDITTALYAKYEKSSDETTALKKEIEALKKEVARLKKENDLLKKGKKVKKGS